MRKSLTTALLGAALAALEVLFFSSPWGQRLEYLAGDLWYQLRGREAPPSDIVILAMDEESYRVLNLPMDRAWPRSLHAEALQRLRKLGARRVLMDIIFQGAGQDSEADEDLAEAIASVPVVLGADTGFREQSVWTSDYVIEDLVVPYAPFAKAAEQVALVKMPEDDGFIRRLKLPRSRLTQSFPLLYEAALGRRALDPALVGDRDMIRYYGPPGTVRTYAYHTLLGDMSNVPPEAYKNKIVFIGLNMRTGVGPTAKDTFGTPLRTAPMYGVEVQATAAANLIQGKILRRFPAFTEASLLFVVSLALAASVIAVRPQWGAAVAGSSVIGWAGAAYAAFLSGLFLPGATLVMIILPLGYTASTVVYYLITYRAQQHIEKAFRLYLPPQMARRMRTHKNALELGGEEVWGTALFTDIAGFTQIAEQMPARDVAGMLNEYFTEIVKVFFSHQGTVVKFLGDAVFVIWGAPISLPDHARLSFEAALAVQKDIANFNKGKRFPPLQTRIGLHTGQMLVGNLGAAERFDYTAIGDTVNLASRLEGANKYFGTSILISETTAVELRQSAPLVELGTLCAAGKKAGIKVYTVLEEPFGETARDVWSAALAEFRQRKWREASENFLRVCQCEPQLSKAARLYLSRAQAFEAKPPSQDWAGEIVLSEK